jgi:hypothetical protein
MGKMVGRLTAKEMKDYLKTYFDRSKALHEAHFYDELHQRKLPETANPGPPIITLLRGASEERK